MATPIVAIFTCVVASVVDIGQLNAIVRLSGLMVVAALTIVFATRHSLRIPELLRGRRWLTVLGVTVGTAPLLIAISLMTIDIHRYYAADEDPSARESAVGLADFSAQQLDHVRFVAQDLAHTDFSRAVLSDVDFDRANLNEASFADATFQHVNLAQASLCGADLRGADLRGAEHLDQVADWRFTVYDDRTRWPKKFDIEQVAGPVHAWTGSLVYSCTSDTWAVRPL